MPIARSTPAQKPRGLARRTSTAVILPAASAALTEQPVPDQQRRADGDRRIGGVEGREVIPARVQQHEVHHVAEDDPVPQVAERTAEDEREAGAEEAFIGMA